MSRFYPFQPQLSSRVMMGADVPGADSLVTAQSCDARESNATKNGVIAALVVGIGGFVLGQHLGVSKRKKD